MDSGKVGCKFNDQRHTAGLSLELAHSTRSSSEGCFSFLSPVLLTVIVLPSADAIHVCSTSHVDLPFLVHWQPPARIEEIGTITLFQPTPAISSRHRSKLLSVASSTVSDPMWLRQVRAEPGMTCLQGLLHLRSGHGEDETGGLEEKRV